jgi:hypothetical protein
MSPWQFEIMLCEFSDDEWIYRRKQSIRGPLKDFGWVTADGVNVIAPEIQLLYKSRSPREKDVVDFENCLKKFSQKQSDWLRSAIQLDSGKGHPWLMYF